MAIKVNFTLPEDVVTRLRYSVRDRERSAFVADAVRTKLAQLEAVRLEAELTEGYQVATGEASAIEAEWGAITMESWPADDDD